MFRLMIKNSGFYALLLAMSAGGMGWYWLDTRTVMDMTVLSMQVTGLFTWTLFGMFNVELLEDRFHGYMFLGTLPVTPRGIVAAKLVPNFISVMVFAYSSWYIFTTLGGPEPSVEAAVRLLVVSTPVPLIASALLYAAIFRFGYAIVRNVMIALMLLGYIAPIILMEFAVPGAGISFESIGVALAGAALPSILAIEVIFWGLSVLLAIKIKEKRYE